jgi:sugar phosphate isomerase/epimerase
MGIAVQLYSIRHMVKEDMLGALGHVAEIGYRAVEFAGYGNATVPEIRQRLDDLGVRAVSAHVGFDRFANEIDKVIEEMTALGCTHAVVPWLAQEWRGAERMAELGDRFNAWGVRCREAGIRFGYHNHDFELEPVGDGLLLDLMIEATDPSLVDIQIDFYFTAAAGVDGAALVRRLAGRVPTLHMKDLAPGPELNNLAVGAGLIDWEPILAAAKGAGTEWYIVEQESQPLDLARSLRFLEARLGDD